MFRHLFCNLGNWFRNRFILDWFWHLNSMKFHERFLFNLNFLWDIWLRRFLFWKRYLIRLRWIWFILSLYLLLIYFLFAFLHRFFLDKSFNTRLLLYYLVLFSGRLWLFLNFLNWNYRFLYNDHLTLILTLHFYLFLLFNFHFFFLFRNRYAIFIGQIYHALLTEQVFNARSPLIIDRQTQSHKPDQTLGIMRRNRCILPHHNLQR